MKRFFCRWVSEHTMIGWLSCCIVYNTVLASCSTNLLNIITSMFVNICLVLMIVMQVREEKRLRKEAENFGAAVRALYADPSPETRAKFQKEYPYFSEQTK